jgi:hypothetical protein
MRYWYSVHDTGCMGWCFGDTPEAARDNAAASIKRWGRWRGHGTITLQSDQDPYGERGIPAEYFDLPITV